MLISSEISLEVLNKLLEVAKKDAGSFFTKLIVKSSKDGQHKELYLTKTDNLYLLDVRANGRSVLITDSRSEALDSYNNVQLLRYSPEETSKGLSPDIAALPSKNKAQILIVDEILKSIDHVVMLYQLDTPFKTKRLDMHVKGALVSYVVVEDSVEVISTEDLNTAVDKYNSIVEDDSLVRGILEKAILEYKTATNACSEFAQTSARAKLFSLVSNA